MGRQHFPHYESKIQEYINAGKVAEDYDEFLTMVAFPVSLMTDSYYYLLKLVFEAARVGYVREPEKNMGDLIDGAKEELLQESFTTLEAEPPRSNQYLEPYEYADTTLLIENRKLLAEKTEMHRRAQKAESALHHLAPILQIALSYATHTVYEKAGRLLDEWTPKEVEEFRGTALAKVAETNATYWKQIEEYRRKNADLYRENCLLHAAIKIVERRDRGEEAE